MLKLMAHSFFGLALALSPACTDFVLSSSCINKYQVNIRVKSLRGVLMSTLMAHSSFGSALALSPAGTDFVLSSNCINKYQGKYKSEIINRCIDVNINGPLFIWLSFGFISRWY